MDDVTDLSLQISRGLLKVLLRVWGLDISFWRHIERTRVLIHLVDAASTEGRDPIDDIYKINKELEAYDPELSKRPQVIAANKIDAIYEGDEDLYRKSERNSNLRALRFSPFLQSVVKA